MSFSRVRAGLSRVDSNEVELQSVSSAASLSPLSSDDQAAGGAGDSRAHEQPSGGRWKRRGGPRVKRRRRPALLPTPRINFEPLPPGLSDMSPPLDFMHAAGQPPLDFDGVSSPPRRSFSGSPPRRSFSPPRRVRYSPSPPPRRRYSRSPRFCRRSWSRSLSPKRRRRSSSRDRRRRDLSPPMASYMSAQTACSRPPTYAHPNAHPMYTPMAAQYVYPTATPAPMVPHSGLLSSYPGAMVGHFGGVNTVPPAPTPATWLSGTNTSVPPPVAVGPALSQRIDSQTVMREVEKRKAALMAGQAGTSDQTDNVHIYAANKSSLSAKDLKRLIEIRRMKPWMNEDLLLLRMQMEEYKKKFNDSDQVYKTMSRRWNEMVGESKSKLETPHLTKGTLHRLLKRRREFEKRRDKLAGRLQQLKQQYKQMNQSNVIRSRDGQIHSNAAVNANLKQQVSLQKDMQPIVSVIDQLSQVIERTSEVGDFNELQKVVDELLTRKPDEEPQPDETEFLILGDDAVKMLTSYITADPERAAFSTDVEAAKFCLQGLSDLRYPGEERFQVAALSAVRHHQPVTLMLLLSAELLQTESFRGERLAEQVVRVCEQMRGDGVRRVVVIGVPVQTQKRLALRADELERCLEREVAAVSAGQLIFQPITHTDEEFGVADRGTGCKNLYKAVHLAVKRCIEMGAPPLCPTVPDTLTTVADAVVTTQAILEANRDRLASIQTQRLSSVSALLEKLRDKKPVDELLLGQNLDEEDTGIYFRDPADHVCLLCHKLFMNAKMYLQHLTSADHERKHKESQSLAPETPWQKHIPPVGQKSNDARREPIKGLDMFVRVECWYCKACDTFIGDLRCASSHLKSRRHNKNYDEYLDNNPGYNAVISETRSQLLLNIAAQEQQRTKQRRREEMERRGEQLNQLMRSRSGSDTVQDVTDDSGSATPSVVPAAVVAPAAAVAPPKKSSIKLNLLSQPEKPPSEFDALKKKVQANIAEEQANLEAVERERADRVREEREVVPAALDDDDIEVLSGPEPNAVGQLSASAPKVKITLPEKSVGRGLKVGASSGPVKKAPLIGKLPKLRARKPELTGKTTAAAAVISNKSCEKPGALDDSQRAIVEMANRQLSTGDSQLELIASDEDEVQVMDPGQESRRVLVRSVSQINGAETISDEEDGVGDLLDIDLPEVPSGELDDDDMLMLGISSGDVAAGRMKATKPPLSTL